MKSKSNKSVIILLAVLGVSLVFAYMTMNGDDALVVETDNVVIGERTIELLGKIQAVKLDFNVLQSPEFSYLKSIASPLPNLPIGRQNPFAPAR